MEEEVLVRDFCNRVSRHIPQDEVEVKVILDLGSRDGRASTEFSRLFPSADVFAFECNPPSIQTCARATRNNSRIHLMPYAVHVSNGIVEFYPIDSAKSINTGASSLLKSSGKYDSIEAYPQRTTIVKAIRLDSWAEQNGIERFDLVWIDLQGSELIALLGMGRFLKTVKAIHTEVEYDEMYVGQPTFPLIDGFLSSQGFTLTHKTVVIENWYGDVEYIRSDLLTG